VLDSIPEIDDRVFSADRIASSVTELAQIVSLVPAKDMEPETGKSETSISFSSFDKLPKFSDIFAVSKEDI
jgi:hypothetical protein